MKIPVSSTCLVSSCLVGLCTRYDGRIITPDSRCLQALSHSHWIPVCPEQLGGLPTPREKAVLTHGDGHDVLAGRALVLTESGLDVTENFIRGAGQVLLLARATAATVAILKARSPSCGIQGTIGVTAALLQAHGIELHEY